MNNAPTPTTPQPSETLRIGSREFRVERLFVTKDGLPSYVLHGARGATYMAMRFIDAPDQMFVIGANGRSPSGLESVRLTDATGSLEASR